MPSPPTTTLESNLGARSTPALMRETFSMPLHLGTTPPATEVVAKSLRAVMESQKLTILVNTYHIHFEQYPNRPKKKMTQIIPYAMWKKT